MQTFSLRLRFSIVPPSDASPIRVKLLALSVDIILQSQERFSNVVHSKKL